MSGAIKRRIMRKFVINEISGCVAPAQEGARVAIFGSADPPREAATPPRVEQSTMAQEREFSKAEIGDMLDRLAKSYSVANQVTYAKAYDAVLATDVGAQLYAMSRVVEKQHRRQPGAPSATGSTRWRGGTRRRTGSVSRRPMPQSCPARAEKNCTAQCAPRDPF